MPGSTTQAQRAFQGYIELSTPYEDQEKLALDLGLTSPNEVLDEEEFRRRIQDWLLSDTEHIENRNQQGRQKDIEEMMQRRMFFETLMAWDVLRNNNEKLLIDHLESNWEHMSRLLGEPFSFKVASECWTVDGDFHLSICLASNRDDLANFIKIVIEYCREIGTSKTLSRATRTLAEHRMIIDALKEGNPNKVFDAIRTHVTNGVNRWFEVLPNLMQNDDPDNKENRHEWLIKLLTEPLGEPATKGVQSELAFRSQLPNLLRQHNGKWVAFLGSDIIAMEQTRERLERKCKSYCKTHQIQYHDLACHRISVNEANRSR